MIDKKRKLEEKFKDDLSSSMSDLGYSALLEQANQAEDFGLRYLEHSIKFASDPINGPMFQRKSEESYERARSIREIANSKVPASLNTPST